VLKKTNVAAAASAVALGAGVVATAAFAADEDDRALQPQSGSERAEVRTLQREGEALSEAITAHHTEKLTDRYRNLYWKAEDLDAEPKKSIVAEQNGAELDELIDEVPDLREDVAKAEKKEEAAAPTGDFGLVGGVSQETLDAIAACESGGDPTAVNAAGYYGKYQFDMGTWASVGGSGNPAEASEEEQDMRASMLYAQSGATPWPVCGQ
jgi:soluble lytic murein transglycosylase-like protein